MATPLRLKNFLHRLFPTRSPQPAPRAGGLLFVFEGRSGVWSGLGKQLYAAEGGFRDTLRACNELVERRLGLRLFDDAGQGIMAPEGQVVEAEIRILLWNACLQMAMADLWRSHGVVPDAVVGMSNGEYVAAYASRILSLEAAIDVLAAMSQMISFRRERCSLLTIEMPAERLGELATCCPPMDLMVELSPDSVVVCCTKDDVAAIQTILGDKGISHKAHWTDWPYHTPRMWRNLEWMRRQLDGVKPQAWQGRFYSTLKGSLLPGDWGFDVSYWHDIVCFPVLIRSALRAAVADGLSGIVTISPFAYPQIAVSSAVAAGGGGIPIFKSITFNEPELQTFAKSRQALAELGLIKQPAGAWQLPAIPGAGKYDKAFFRDPYPLLSQMREREPVSCDPKSGIWTVRRYEDVAVALEDYERFSSQDTNFAAVDPTLPGADPPVHTQRRQVLRGCMTHCQPAQISAFCQDWMAEWCAGIGAGRTLDVMADLAVPLPESLMGHLLGFSAEETAEMRALLPAHRCRILESMTTVTEWVTRYLAAQPADSGKGICAGLLRAEAEGVFTREQTISLARVMWFAGSTTTHMLIGSMALRLLKDPALLQQLRDNRGLLSAFIEEVLRLESPLQEIPRTAAVDISLAGVTIPQGARIVLHVGSANRDPAHFPDPDVLVLNRQPRDHLAFGSGVHLCIGAALARVIARVVLDQVFLSNYLVEAEEPLAAVCYEPVRSLRAVQALQVTVKPVSVAS